MRFNLFFYVLIATSILSKLYCLLCRSWKHQAKQVNKQYIILDRMSASIIEFLKTSISLGPMIEKQILFKKFKGKLSVSSIGFD